jgi:hypothetical protein
MNDSDISDLARMLPAPEDRDFPAGRRQVLKEHLMTEFRRTANHRGAPPLVHRLRSRPRITGGLTAGTALAAAAVALVALLAGHSADSGGPRPGTPTAASLLAKIASTVAGQPAPVVKNSDFTYVKSETTEFSATTTGKAAPASQGQTMVGQLWLSVSDTCAAGMLEADGVPTRTAGSGPCGIGNLDHPTYRFAQTLPTSPRALLDYITKRAGERNAFLVLDGLINTAVLPPRLWGAVYRAAALIPGVTAVDNVPNVFGQRGIAIQESSGESTYQWIFNPKTLRYIGSRAYITATGQTTSESDVISTGIVARAGELP